MQQSQRCITSTPLERFLFGLWIGLFSFEDGYPVLPSRNLFGAERAKARDQQRELALLRRMAVAAFEPRAAGAGDRVDVIDEFLFGDIILFENSMSRS